MSKYYAALGTFLIGIALAGSSPVFAQAPYPNKTIRIVTVAVGGATDNAARILAQGLTNSIGQQVIVENRGGVGGVIAAQTVMKSPPDGYTLLFYSDPFWLNPFLRQSVPYDPVVDFAPIALNDRSTNVLVVHPSLPVKSLRELVDLAKARPGALSYSAASAGSMNSLGAELFKIMAGVNILGINYKGGGAANFALLAGEVQLSIMSIGASGAEYIKSGRLRALAVTGAQPSRLLPDVPTIDASGYPGFEAVLSNGMFALAGTPEVIIKRVNQEIIQVLRRPDVKERYNKAGADPVGNSPEEFKSFVKSEMAKWGKIIKAANIRAD